jgi:hypothetical protein
MLPTLCERGRPRHARPAQVMHIAFFVLVDDPLPFSVAALQHKPMIS